jgi:Type II secretion system (T2SS), protein E, N-terminal domain
MATVEDEHVSPEAEALAGTDEPARVPLGQLLIDAGLINQAQLDDALFEGSRTGERVGEVVVRKGLVTEDDVARLLAEQWELDYVERSAIWFDADALARLSREDAQRLEALPTRIEGGRVVVAVAEPTEQRLAALREVIGEETVVIVVPKSALDAGLRSDLLRSASAQGGAPAGADEAVPELEAEPAADYEPEPDAEPEDEPVVLAEVTQLPVQRVNVPVDSDDPAASLADEAQAVAERLLSQAAAVRAQQQELRHKTEQYEARVAELEQILSEREQALAEREQALADLDHAFEERTAQLAAIRQQLADVLAAFDD